MQLSTLGAVGSFQPPQSHRKLDTTLSVWRV